MKLSISTSIFCAAVLFYACSSGPATKVLVMASGDFQINGNTITLKPGTRHNESTFSPSENTITVEAPSGATSFTVDGPGLYLLNLKKDTVVGSYQRVGTDNSQQIISQESLKQRLDSLSQLLAGSNVSAAARNYNLPPFAIRKITDNTGAEIIGPYMGMPNSFDPTKEHEIYKFYTSKEMSEIIQKLSTMVDPAPAR